MFAPFAIWESLLQGCDTLHVHAQGLSVLALPAKYIRSSTRMRVETRLSKGIEDMLHKRVPRHWRDRYTTA